MKISKVLTAALATASMMATGLVAAAPAAAAPMGETVFDVRVNRTLNASTPVVVRPGESITINYGITIDDRNENPATNFVSDIAVGDVITFNDNVVTTLTAQGTASYNWYATGRSNGCYTEASALGTATTATWTTAMDTCDPAYLSVSRQVSYSNNTQADATISINPVLTTTGTQAEWVDADAGVSIYGSASVSVYNTTSYTAVQGDIATTIDTPKMCVSRDLATGDRFETVLNVSNGSANLGTTSGSGAYLSQESGRGINGDYSHPLQLEADIQSWSRTGGRIDINTVDPHGITQPTAIDIADTGEADLDAIDNTYAYAADADTLYIYGGSGADVVDTALAQGVVKIDGTRKFSYPAAPTSVITYVSAAIADLVAGETYTVETDVVSSADTSVSVQRPCGLAAPAFTVGTPTYNSVPVTITGVTGADSYQCRAQVNGVTQSTGYLSETTPLTPAGGTCTISGLTSSTAYQISVMAYQYGEGNGAWSSATTATTAANGGGGGNTPQVLGVMQALTGATIPGAVVSGAKTMVPASVVGTASRGYNGANGDVFYAAVSAGTMTITHNTATGGDTRFNGSGSVVIPNVVSNMGVSYLGASGSSWVAAYRTSTGDTGYKWGKLTTAAGQKTQLVTSAQFAAFCAAQFGSAYNSGSGLLIGTPIEAPVVNINCYSISDPNAPAKNVLATIKLASGSTSPIVLVTKLTNYTDIAAPCAQVNYGRNPVAKSTDAAMVAVVTTFAKTNSMCMSGVTPTKREVITVSAAGKKLKSALATTTQILPNSQSMTIAPAYTKNTWIGATTVAAQMGPPAPGHLFTIDANAKVAKKANITFNTTGTQAASNAAFTSYSYVNLLKGVSASNAVGVRIGTATGVIGQSWAGFTINLSTGKVTTGRVQTVTADNYTGYQTGQNMNVYVPTIDFKKVNFYTLTDVAAKQYKVVTWTQATK